MKSNCCSGGGSKCDCPCENRRCDLENKKCVTYAVTCECYRDISGGALPGGGALGFCHKHCDNVFQPAASGIPEYITSRSPDDLNILEKVGYY